MKNEYEIKLSRKKCWQITFKQIIHLNFSFLVVYVNYSVVLKLKHNRWHLRSDRHKCFMYPKKSEKKTRWILLYFSYRHENVCLFYAAYSFKVRLIAIPAARSLLYLCLIIVFWYNLVCLRCMRPNQTNPCVMTNNYDWR